MPTDMEPTSAAAPAHPAREQRERLLIPESALITADPFVELLAGYLKLYPSRCAEAIGWWRNGRDRARQCLAEQLPHYRATIPINSAVLEQAEREAASGRQVYLVSDWGVLHPEHVKTRFPWFAGVVSPSDPDTRDKLTVSALPDGFAGAANSPSAPSGRSELWPLIESLRFHQWIKNLLVFAPLILGGQLHNAYALLTTVVAFLALGLVASATYLVNDILDVADDRGHWSKRYRPIARGDLRASAAAMWAVTGLLAGLALCMLISASAVAVLLVYIALTFAYSIALKRLPLVDGFVLATQFTLRLALGVAAAQVPPSPWLFVFSMFLFTSLSLAKRHTELSRLDTSVTKSIAGRGYRTEDAPLVLAIGAASGLCAVLIITLYIIDDAFRQSFYGTTMWLWGFPPLMFLLICRVWLVTARGEMNDDPVRFILRDPPSQGILAALTLCFLLAWLV